MGTVIAWSIAVIAILMFIGLISAGFTMVNSMVDRINKQ